MKKNWWKWLLLIAALAVMGYSLAAVDAVEDHLQYIVEPSDDVVKDSADLAVLAEEWDITQQTWALGGFIQEANMKAESQSARGRITMYGENGLSLYPHKLLYGRLFTDAELIDGELVALLDEQLAFVLFREIDAVGRTFTLGGMTYRIIGVVSHTRQVGDSADYGAYIPLLSGLQPEALVVEADPLPGVGAGASFSSVCGLWRSGGTFIDLYKESVGATLWARMLGFGVGAIVLLKGIRWLNKQANASIGYFQRKLQRKYASQLLLQMAGVVLAFVFGYATVTMLAVRLLDFILLPVYVFPECVPAVLVEWEEIQTTFWQVQYSAANYRELRTPELSRLRYLKALIQLTAAVVACLSCMCLNSGHFVFKQKRWYQRGMKRSWR